MGEDRNLMLTFVYGDNDCAEDMLSAAQKYADVHNDALRNHDIEKLKKLETISGFLGIVKKEFLKNESYPDGYIDFDDRSLYTIGSIDETMKKLFDKYKNMQEKNVCPALSNFWCNGEMCIVLISHGLAKVYIK